MDWSVIGIVLSLAFIVVLALRGWHIIIIAPLAVVITILAVSGLTHVNAYKHIFFGHVVATTIALFFAIPLGIWIYG